MNIQVVFDRRKTGKMGTFEIFLYVSRNDAVYISTRVRIDRSLYDKKQNRVSAKHHQADALNHQIFAMVRKFEDEHLRLLRENKKITTDALLLSIKEPESTSLNEYMRRQFELDRPTLSPGRQRTVKSILNDFDAFGSYTFDSFNGDALRMYHNSLLQHKAVHSTSVNHKLIKKYLSRAQQNHLLTENVYESFKIPKTREKRVFLNADELERLRQYKGHPRLEHVRDLFLFQCNTGLSFSDMMTLTPDDVIEENGHRFIVKRRQKTDVEMLIPLFDEAAIIIDKYSSNGKIFRGLSNQRMNSYLKELAAGANIVKELTSHIGRHTYATTLLTKGMPLESVSHMLGHNDLKTTRIYARVVSEKLLGDMKRLNIQGI